jgi:hypothetical protein
MQENYKARIFEGHDFSEALQSMESMGMDFDICTQEN